MFKLIFISVLLCIMLINNVMKSQAQVFKVQSFDGTSGEVKVMSLNSRGILKISYLGDVINMVDVNYVKSTGLLNKHFLKVVYAVRAGTGMNMVQTVILSINNKRLHQSMHITSLFEENFIDFSKPVDTANMVDVHTINKINLIFLDDVHDGIKVKVNIHDERTSKRNTGEDFKNDIDLVLNFDVNRHIFYDSLKKVSRYFTVYDAKNRKEARRYIAGTYPAMRLGRSVYYYIKDEWYENDEYGNLSGFSYR